LLTFYHLADKPWSFQNYLNKFKSPLVAKTGVVSNIPKKTPKARGLSEKGRLSSSLSHRELLRGAPR
jgi:hypothetical protein